MGFLDAFLKADIGTVGLDIGSHSIKAVEISRKGGRLGLSRYGIGALPPDVIVDGEIMDREVVVDCIQELLEENGISAKNVASAISGRSVIVKRITMDVASEEEAKDAIYWEAEQHVPYGIDEVTLDFQILAETAEGQKDILLVAAKKETVEMHTSLLYDAGLVPYVVDVDSLAMQNSFEMNYESDPEEKILLLNVGASVTNVSLLSGGAPLFTRDLSVAGNAFIEEIQRVFNVDRDEAEKLMKGFGEDGAEDERMGTILENVGQDLLLGVERSLSYLKGNTGSAEVSRAYISGGGALIRGFHSFLSERLGVPVEITNPMRNLPHDPEVFGEAGADRAGPPLVVAVGLALR